MQIVKSLDPATVAGKTKELFAVVERRLQQVPNMVRVLAYSPGILESYLGFNRALEQTTLSPKLRFLISVTVSEINECDYTLATAILLAQREGVSEDELNAARRAESSDPKTGAALRFAAKAARNRGLVTPAETQDLRKAGFVDQEIVEIVAAVAFNAFRNYFNLMAGTELDLPLVKTDGAHENGALGPQLTVGGKR